MPSSSFLFLKTHLVSIANFPLGRGTRVQTLDDPLSILLLEHEFEVEFELQRWQLVTSLLCCSEDLKCVPEMMKQALEFLLEMNSEFSSSKKSSNILFSSNSLNFNDSEILLAVGLISLLARLLSSSKDTLMLSWIILVLRLNTLKAFDDNEYPMNLPSSAFLIDCFKNNPKLMWAQLEKIMLGSTVATQLRHTRYMNNIEEYKAKDGESLKNVYDMFCAVINDLRKIKVEKTELETNLKFFNSLQPEWNKSCHRLRNDVRISTMQIQEMYDILLTDECIVTEKKAKLDKKNKKTVDPGVLLTSKLSEQALSENAYDGAIDDVGS
ncbi:hypothetical protein L6452_37157 [Arctium lappa]|uniref:Uncharacterized protein n=1 Tax=Arctium lappa TaxID=4217 RepID=A0ACB8Y2Q0_ARCLA|nr:hypothetical protein L6452_37157 [Arctium lappa]